MPMKLYTVEAFWDAEASVWVATSETILGLATEADTIEALTQKLHHIVPELMALNSLADPQVTESMAIELITHRQIQIAA
jgi:Domain of unknown function (DUF1902)